MNIEAFSLWFFIFLLPKDLYFFRESSGFVTLVERIKICRYLADTNAMYLFSAILFTLFCSILCSWGVWITAQGREGVTGSLKACLHLTLDSRSCVCVAHQRWPFIQHVAVKSPAVQAQCYKRAECEARKVVTAVQRQDCSVRGSFLNISTG